MHVTILIFKVTSKINQIIKRETCLTRVMHFIFIIRVGKQPDCNKVEKCNEDLQICLPRRQCILSNDINGCPQTEICDEEYSLCLPRRRCIQGSDCDKNEICLMGSEHKICMPPKRCDKNGRCPLFSVCNEELFCIPARRCIRKGDCGRNE